MCTACAFTAAKCVGHVAQLGGAECNPALCPSHVGGPSILPQGEHRGPYLFTARHWYPACCPKDSSAPLRHCPILSSQSTAHLSQSIPVIQVIPGNPAESILLPHSIQVDSILHIITYDKYYSYFKSFTCTGLPDQIDAGRFKFASSN